MYSQLETWEGAIRTEIDKHGNFRVLLGDKYDPDELIASGNVGDLGTRFALAHGNEGINNMSLYYEEV
jgi:hypothetical protein